MPVIMIGERDENDEKGEKKWFCYALSSECCCRAEQGDVNGHKRLGCPLGWGDDKLPTTGDLLLFNCILITWKGSVQAVRGSEQKLPYQKIICLSVCHC